MYKLLYYHNQLFNQIRSRLNKKKQWGPYHDLVYDLETKAGYLHTKAGSESREIEKKTGIAIWGQFTAFVDRKNEIQGIWNMDHNMPYIDQSVEYPEARIPFEDIMFEVACDFAATGKTIDVMWSGGLDSTAALLALYNVCPKQLRVIMSKGSIEENPGLYEKMVKHMDHVISGPPTARNITQESDCMNHIFGSCAEADNLVGGMIQTDPIVNVPEEEKRDRWFAMHRFFTAAKSWKLMACYTGEKVNPANYKPFYCHPLMEKYHINKCHDGEMPWYQALPVLDENGEPVEHSDGYLQAKPDLRNYISKHFDSGWARSKSKVPSVEHGQNFTWNESLNRTSPPHYVLAITSDGRVINKDNVNSFDLLKYLNPKITGSLYEKWGLMSPRAFGEIK